MMKEWMPPRMGLSDLYWCFNCNYGFTREHKHFDFQRQTRIDTPGRQ